MAGSATGYPVAHEDDAQRAVRAALAPAMSAPGAPKGLGGAISPRAAAATGSVAATRASARPCRQRPHIATRLLASAAPGVVVVSSASTRRSAERLLTSRPREQSRRARAAGDARARRARERRQTVAPARRARRSSAATRPVAGARPTELAREGQGQALLVTASPARQSRLLFELAERLRGGAAPPPRRPALTTRATRCVRILTCCRASPIWRALTRRQARAARGDAAWSARRPRAFHAARGRPVTPPDERGAARAHPAEARGADAALLQPCWRPARQPVVLVEESALARPPSEEVLDALVRQARAAAVLVISTARPGTSPAWAGEEHVTRLALGRLSRLHTGRLVARLGSELPAAIVEQLLSRADGVPLFAEELTRAISDAADSQGRKLTPEALATLMPATLQESLAARLARLGSVQGTAQLARCSRRSSRCAGWRRCRRCPPTRSRRLERSWTRACCRRAVPRRPRAISSSTPSCRRPPTRRCCARRASSTTRRSRRRWSSSSPTRPRRNRTSWPTTTPRRGTRRPRSAGGPGPPRARASASRAARRSRASGERRSRPAPGLPEGRERDGRGAGAADGACAGCQPSVLHLPRDRGRALRAQELCDRAASADTFFVQHGLWAFHPCAGVSPSRARAREEPARGRGEARRHAVGARRTLRARLHARRRGRPGGGPRLSRAGEWRRTRPTPRVPSFHAGWSWASRRRPSP